MHGNLEHADCIDCGARYDAGVLDVEVNSLDDVPRCPRCRGLLKPSIVLFEEALPAEAIRRAFAEAERADLFMVVGSSLEVGPVNGVPAHAHAFGAKLVILNMSPTHLDPLAALLVREPAGGCSRRAEEMGSVDSERVRERPAPDPGRRPPEARPRPRQPSTARTRHICLCAWTAGSNTFAASARRGCPPRRCPFQHDQAVGVAQGRAGAIAMVVRQAVPGLLNLVLRFGVDGPSLRPGLRSSDRAIWPGDGDALPLPAGKSLAPPPTGVVTVRKTHDEVMRWRSSADHLFGRGVIAA